MKLHLILFCFIISTFQGCGKHELSRSSSAVHAVGANVPLDLKHPSSSLVSPDLKWTLFKFRLHEGMFYLGLRYSNGNLQSSSIIHEDKYVYQDDLRIYWNAKNQLVFEKRGDIFEIWNLQETTVLTKDVVIRSEK